MKSRVVARHAGAEEGVVNNGCSLSLSLSLEILWTLQPPILIERTLPKSMNGRNRKKERTKGREKVGG